MYAGGGIAINAEMDDLTLSSSEANVDIFGSQSVTVRSDGSVTLDSHQGESFVSVERDITIDTRQGRGRVGIFAGDYLDISGSDVILKDSTDTTSITLNPDGINIKSKEGASIFLSDETQITGNLYVNGSNVVTTTSVPTATSTVVGGFKTGYLGPTGSTNIPVAVDSNSKAYATVSAPAVVGALAAMPAVKMPASNMPSAVKGSAVGNSSTTTNGGTKGAVRIVVSGSNLYIYTGTNAG